MQCSEKIEKNLGRLKSTSLPQKIKLQKHLNADALFIAIYRKFEKIPEFRGGDIEISIPDALMSAFAMFSLKIPSLLKFNKKSKSSILYGKGE